MGCAWIRTCSSDLTGGLGVRCEFPSPGNLTDNTPLRLRHPSLYTRYVAHSTLNAKATSEKNKELSPDKSDRQDGAKRDGH